MLRFAAQADLFASAHQSATPPPPSGPPPLAQLAALLAMLRSAERLPWPDTSTALAQEHCAMAWARAAGSDGERLLSAIFDEIERLFAADERPMQSRT